VALSICTGKASGTLGRRCGPRRESSVLVRKCATGFASASRALNGALLTPLPARQSACRSTRGLWPGAVRLHATHGAKISKDMFTDTAAGQVGTGIRHGSTKRDAAHMMNTTYVPQTGAKVPNQSRVHEFLRLSSATTQQTQRANVSSDKVIDSVQTIYKNKVLSHYATSPPRHRTTASTDKKSKTGSRTIEGIFLSA